MFRAAPCRTNPPWMRGSIMAEYHHFDGVHAKGPCPESGAGSYRFAFAEVEAHGVEGCYVGCPDCGGKVGPMRPVAEPPRRTVADQSTVDKEARQ